MASTPMQFLTRRFGMSWFWAAPEDRFTKPGLTVWVPIFRRHFRILKARKVGSTRA